MKQMIKLSILTAIVGMSTLFGEYHYTVDGEYHYPSNRVRVVLGVYDYPRYLDLPYYHYRGRYYYGGHYRNGVYYYRGRGLRHGRYYYRGYRHCHRKHKRVLRHLHKHKAWVRVKVK